MPDRSHRLYNVERFRRAARRKIPRPVFDFVDGGAEDEVTERTNTEAYRALRLLPRVLVNTGERDLSTTVCGIRLDVPLICSPTGYVGVVHPDGERAAAIAAPEIGARALVSSAATYSLEELGATGSPFWFQLYPPSERDLTEEMLARASAVGVELLTVTVDVPVAGNRERDIANGWTIQPRLTSSNALSVAMRPVWAYRLVREPRIFTKNYAHPTEHVRYRDAVKLVQRSTRDMKRTTSWDDLAWIRTAWAGKMMVKGIMHPDDARRAVQCGADGVVVSNHGGRQIDGVPASVQMVPQVVEAVGADVTVVADGGVRRGSDVVKALCLGADAVMVGRPWVYGLGAGGLDGVRGVLSVLQAEIDRTLTLIGAASVAELDRSFLWNPPEVTPRPAW
jgi:isopentenyl diphosphate isomerase/L-lactate dehydrogenase-like FMN-dependent dehydrogenase